VDICMWSSYLMDLSPEEMLATFARKGWFSIELSTEHASRLLDRGDPDEAGRAFAGAAHDQGVSVPQGHLWLQADICAIEQDAAISALKRWLDLFLAVGIRGAVLHAGGGELRDAGREAEIPEARTRALGQLIDHVGDEPLVLCLENGAADPTPRRLLEIIRAAGGGPHLGICLDTGHLNMTEGGQGDFIRAAGPLLKALHIADNEGSRDQHLMPYGRERWPGTRWSPRCGRWATRVR